ncbi:MAG: hypothetical protein AB8B79_00735 [Granulosicoccus sp.]
MFSHDSLVTSSRLSLIRVPLLLLALSALSACSTLGLQAPWDREAEPDYDLIAKNLVNSIAQFPHLQPQLATVQITRRNSHFGQHINEELQERGYKLELVNSEEGLNQVKPQIKQSASEKGEQKRYVLTIGQISVERSYAIVADSTVPISEQVIRGAEQRKISLNDDIFEVPDSEFSTVAFKAYEGPLIEDVLAAAPKPKKISSWWKRDDQNAVKNNIYETMSSNYKDVFSGYEDIDQSILIFPNDSLRLGESNKQVIDEYVSKMDPDTDVLSVIGCSHGETEISNGNSLLALGRANRVKEAFLFSGLEHDQILDEGCWAPQTFDEVMPRRGVVLTLKRKKNS